MSAYVARRFDIDVAAPVGGKARALAQLSNAGLPVPAWFVVLPNAFDASVTPALAAELAGAGDEAALGALAARIRLAPAVGAAIESALGAAPNTSRYAVRSSAQEEDSAAHSLAGQLDSFLYVPRPQVAEHVAPVWLSGFGERLVRYRAEAGIADSTAAPAVLVQQMIDGDASGVAFSADPVTGAPCDRCRRRGEGPAATPSSPAPSKPTPGASTAPAPSSSARRPPRPPCSPAKTRSAGGRARPRRERHFGVPQDIEWALAGGRLLPAAESRPITSLAGSADPDGARNSGTTPTSPRATAA